MMTKTRLAGWAAAFGVVGIWSGWLVVSRLGVLQSLTAYDLMALRFLIATIVVSPFVWRHWPRHLNWRQVAVLSFGQGVPFLLLSFGGLQFAPAAHAGIVTNGLLPIFTALLAWVWLRERPSRWRGYGMAFILVGCIMIGWDRETVGAGSEAWLGHLMFVGAALFVAINAIATKAWGLTALQAVVTIPAVNLAWYGPAYLMGLPSGLTEASWPEIALQAGYQGLFPSVLGAVLFTTAIRNIGPASTTAMMALVPGAAAILAIPVLGEWPSALAWTGLAIVTAGIRLAAGWRLS